MVRVKRRYILVDIKLNKQNASFPKQSSFIEEFRNIYEQLYGDFGIACLNRNFHVKRYSAEDCSIIITVRKDVHEMAMSVLPLITKIGDAPCVLNIIHLSGTIRKCLEVLRKNNLMKLRASIGKTLIKNKT